MIFVNKLNKLLLWHEICYRADYDLFRSPNPTFKTLELSVFMYDLTCDLPVFTWALDWYLSCKMWDLLVTWKTITWSHLCLEDTYRVHFSQTLPMVHCYWQHCFSFFLFKWFHRNFFHFHWGWCLKLLVSSGVLVNTLPCGPVWLDMIEEPSKYRQNLVASQSK